jgi:hypothetical protein
MHIVLTLRGLTQTNGQSRSLPWSRAYRQCPGPFSDRDGSAISGQTRVALCLIWRTAVLLQRTQGSRAQASSFCFAILRQKAKLAVDLLSCGPILSASISRSPLQFPDHGRSGCPRVDIRGLPSQPFPEFRPRREGSPSKLPRRWQFSGARRFTADVFGVRANILRNSLLIALPATFIPPDQAGAGVPKPSQS